MYSLMRVGLVALLAVVFATGCEEAIPPISPPDPMSDTSPWEIPLEMGNFAVNGNEAVLYESAEYLNYIHDCTMTRHLPSGNFHTFRLRIFVPQHSDDPSLYVVRLKDIKAHVSHFNGRTEDIFYSGSYIETVRLDFGSALWYSEFEVTAQYSGEGITRDTFMNIVFSFELEYAKRDTDARVSTRDVSVEVFLSDTTDC